MINREPIYAALFAKFAAIPGIKTRSRRLKHWTDVPPSNQPALFQTQITETADKRPGIPTKWTLRAEIYVYVNAGKDPHAIPATAINAVLDAVEAALQPEPCEEEQTLGGLVQRCWISGTIETDEGALGEQSVAIVPIEILP